MTKLLYKLTLLLTAFFMFAGFSSCRKDPSRQDEALSVEKEMLDTLHRDMISRASELMHSDSTWREAVSLLSDVTSGYYKYPEDTALRNTATVAFRLLAEIQMEHSYDYEKAYKTLTTARMIAEEDCNDFQKAFVYGKLSALYYWAADGDPEIEGQSYDFLMRSAGCALKSGNQESMLTAALNMTVVTLDNDTIWQQFRPVVHRILNYDYSEGNTSKAKTIRHMVMGRAFFLDGDTANAEKELAEASKLTGYAAADNRLRYTVDTFMYNIHLSRQDYYSALAILRKSLDNALLRQHLDYQLAVYKKMSDCFRLINEKDSVEYYHNKYLDLEFRFQDLNGYGRIKEYSYLDRIGEIDAEIQQLSVKVQNDKRKKMAAYFSLAIICLLLIFALYTIHTLRRSHRLLYLKNVEMGEREWQNKLLRESLEAEIELLRSSQCDASESVKTGSKPSGEQKQATESEELTKIYTKALAFMETSEAIYQSGFTMTELSAALHLSERSISKAINICHNANFHQLLNEYRIRKVTAIMRSDAARTLTIESIAAQAGFKSRSNFIHVFKKTVGVSPSEYLKMSCAQRE